MKALKTWYETHKYHIMLPDGRTALVTAQGCISTCEEPNPIDWFQYYDDLLQTCFAFDPITQASSILQMDPPEVATSQLRQDLIAECKSYIDEKYRKGKAVYAITQGESPDHQIIEISCHNQKLDSFWTGEWQSTFDVKNGVVSGELKIRCHYFEMGNMQFNLDKQFDSITCKDTSNAAEIIKALGMVENKVSINPLRILNKFYFDIVPN